MKGCLGRGTCDGETLHAWGGEAVEETAVAAEAVVLSGGVTDVK